MNSQQLRQRANKAFADHVCTQTLDAGEWRSWRCAKPGTGTYSFNVDLRPGWLFIHGDIGFMVFTRERDMLPWVRGAIDDPHYMAGKVPNCIATREHSPDDAKQVVREIIPRIRTELLLHGMTRDDRRERIEEWMDATDSDESWSEAQHEMIRAGVISDYHQCEDLTFEVRWCVEALRWWLKAIDTAPVTAVESAVPT